MLFNRDGNRWLMLTPMLLIGKPEFELLNCCHIHTEHCILRCFHREREHESMIRLHDIIFAWEASVFHKLCKWIFLVCTDCSDVIWIMTSMNTRSRVDQLRDRSRGLYARYSSTLRNPQLFRPLLISLHSNLF